MPDAVMLAATLTAGAAASLVWGRALWWVDERSATFRRAVFFALGHSRRRTTEVRSLLLSAIYLALALLLSLALAVAFRIAPASLLRVAPRDAVTTLLGIVAEISLANLLVDLAARAMRAGPAQFAEIGEIPWIKGIAALPPAAIPVVTIVAACAEELFYRGVLLRVLIGGLRLEAWTAIAAAAALFSLQQLVQVRTAFQAVVIGCGCVASSLVGGLLAIVTGSAVPALLAHASFVVFFVRPKP